MGQAAFGGEAFSTDVDIWIEYGTARIPLCEVGPDFVYAREPRAVPAGEEVILIISVDGRLYRHRVVLVNGMSGSNPQAAIETAVAPF